VSEDACPVCDEPKEKTWHLVCPYCWVNVPDADKEAIYDLYSRAHGSEAHSMKCRTVLRTLMIGRRAKPVSLHCGKREPRGFVCSQCEKTHMFPSYVMAHWNTPLEIKCECGAVFDVKRGIATHNPKKK